MPVLFHTPAQHGAVQDIEGCEQGGGAVTLVVMGHGGALARLQRQAGLGPVKRLDLALFVNGQHHGMAGRLHVKAHHILDLLSEGWIAGLLERAQPVRLKDLSEAHGIPGRFLVQILLQLKASGLVRTVRGASGGYRLARPPEDISLAEIVDRVDRSEARFEAAASPVVTAVREVWRQVAIARRHVLSDINLAQLADRVRADSFVYQI